MTMLIWIVMILLFLYTIGFSISLWREKNKAGSIAVFVLAGATVASAFFGVLK
ncbi:hypothetical protein ACFYKT_14195 [Cytobacillus sp. FJAT-53684]|uniref:Uncharacterized protein n=1 Tax=Cytobacillus mangrovibacter TaxID=3299024 RepID=A0ABW6K2G1_9BACI